MLRSLRLSPNGSIASPSATSKVLDKVEFVEDKYKRVAQCDYDMPTQFGRADARKPFVESAPTMARLPNEFETVAAPWMPEIERSARLNRTVKSDERVKYLEMWNKIFTSSCYAAEQSGNFKSTGLSVTRTTI